MPHKELSRRSLGQVAALAGTPSLFAANARRQFPETFNGQLPQQPTTSRALRMTTAKSRQFGTRTPTPPARSPMATQGTSPSTTTTARLAAAQRLLPLEPDGQL